MNSWFLTPDMDGSDLNPRKIKHPRRNQEKQDNPEPLPYLKEQFLGHWCHESAWIHSSRGPQTRDFLRESQFSWYHSIWFRTKVQSSRFGWAKRKVAVTSDIWHGVDVWFCVHMSSSMILQDQHPTSWYILVILNHLDTSWKCSGGLGSSILLVHGCAMDSLRERQREAIERLCAKSPKGKPVETHRESEPTQSNYPCRDWTTVFSCSFNIIQYIFHVDSQSIKAVCNQIKYQNNMCVCHPYCMYEIMWVHCRWAVFDKIIVLKVNLCR